jgi:hypothetical protein
MAETKEPVMGKWVDAETNEVVPAPPTAKPEEDEEEYEYDVSEEEEKKAIKQTKQKTDYTEVVEAMPELKQDLDYLLIINKIKNGEKISPKEQEFKMVYEDAKRKEQMFALQQEQKMREEEERQKELQEQINKEYEELRAKNPEKIETHDSNKALSVKGSDNFLKIAMTFLSLRKMNKKGGKIFIKVSRPKKVSIEWTTKDIRFVEFWSTNERGDKVKEVSRVNQYQYTFEGTSIPVIFAIQGFAEAWDFYSEFKKDLSSEIVSGIAMEAYNTGYKDGLVVSDKKKGSGLLGFLTEFMPLILVVGLLIIGYLLYQNYQSMAAVYNTVQIMQGQLATIAPTIDVNAMVLR